MLIKEIRLKAHRRPAPDQLPPITSLGSRREIMLSKRPNTIPRNAFRHLVIRHQHFHYLRQITKIASNLDEILVWAGRNHEMVMMLYPL
jgi:hypothetical protein